jgi:hypothetical protein
MSEPSIDFSTPAPDASSGGFIDNIDAAFASFNDIVDGADAQQAIPEPTVPLERVEAPEPTSESSEAPEDATEAPEAQDEPDADYDESDPLNELDEVNTKSWTPEAARRFKELKSELRETKQLLQDRESALSERENRLKELDAVANNPEFDQLRTKVEDYEKRMLVTDLESSPVYQELVQQPLTDLVSETYAIAEKYGLDGDSLVDALALDDEAAQEDALSDLLAGASDRDKFRVYKIVDDIKPILQRRVVLRENAQEALREAEELQVARERQKVAERVQHRTATAHEVAERLKSKLTFLNDIEGVDLKALTKEAAEFDPQFADDVTSSYQVMTSKLFPKLAREYVSLRKEIDSLTDKLAEYDNAKPRAGSGSAVGGAGNPVGADGKSFLDAVTAAFG